MSNILVVEDDQILGQEVVEALSDEGYVVYWAQTSMDAWQALDSQPIELVFLDIMLPGDQDGYEILHQMRSHEKYKNTPVIVMTNLGQMTDVDKAMQLGATDYIVKANIETDKVVEIADFRLKGEWK